MQRLRTRLRAGASTFPSATFALNFLTGGLDPAVTFTRSTTATFVGSNGLIQTAAINGPRFDYDPVTLAAKGLLIEEQRTNLLLRSEEFDNASWTKSAVTVTANAAISPDGTTNADSVIEDTATSDHRVNQGAISIGAGQNTLSCFIKAGSRTFARIQFDGTVGGVASSAGVNVNLSTGALGTVAVVGNITSGTATATAFGNGWYRVTLTATLSVAVTGASTRIFILQSIGGSTSYTGNGTGNILLYGAQLEAGAFATSYIPTVASQVTRSADVATMTGTNFSSWYNQSEGTFVTSVQAVSGRLLSANDGSTANRILVFNRVSETSISANIIVATLTQASLSRTVADTSAINSVSLAYKENDFAFCANGGVVQTDGTGTVPTVSQLDIGREFTIAGVGHIRQIAYYNTRLPNATLQALTA